MPCPPLPARQARISTRPSGRRYSTCRPALGVTLAKSPVLCRPFSSFVLLPELGGGDIAVNILRLPVCVTRRSGQSVVGAGGGFSDVMRHHTRLCGVSTESRDPVVAAAYAQAVAVLPPRRAPLIICRARVDRTAHPSSSKHHSRSIILIARRPQLLPPSLLLPSTRPR